jgi:hypothetical protein
MSNYTSQKSTVSPVPFRWCPQRQRVGKISRPCSNYGSQIAIRSATTTTTDSLNMADLSPHPSLSERRKHKRLDLRVSTCIFRGPEVIQITTQNISIGGFYGLTEERFSCGEQFDSVIELNASPSDNGTRLQCVVRVVRVDTMTLDGVNDGSARFGVAFCMENYQVANSQF